MYLTPRLLGRYGYTKILKAALGDTSEAGTTFRIFKYFISFTALLFIHLKSFHISSLYFSLCKGSLITYKDEERPQIGKERPEIG